VVLSAVLVRTVTQSIGDRFVLSPEEAGGTGTGTKSSFLRHFILKTERLPRQAQDSHRENSKNRGRFLFSRS
jgi:hypothetical protein